VLEYHYITNHTIPNTIVTILDIYIVWCCSVQLPAQYYYCPCESVPFYG